MRRKIFPQGTAHALIVFALMLTTSACIAANESNAAMPTATPHLATPSAIATIGLRVNGWT